MSSLFESHRARIPCRSQLQTGLLIALTLLVFFATPAVRAGDTSRILFVSSQTSTPYLRFIETARQELQANAAPPIDIVSLPASQLTEQPGGGVEQHYDMVIALGGRAALAIQQWRVKAPVLYTLVPRATYNSLMQSGRVSCPGRVCTAIYIDQPLQRMFRILAVAFTDRRETGVLLGPVSEKQQDELATLAGKTGFHLHTAKVHKPDELMPALDRLLKQAGLLLAIADPVVYNPRTAKSILLTTYHYRVPVVAYSKAYADAGATLSVYSTPEQIAQQTAGIIRTFLTTGKRGLPSPAYPEHYSIRINPHVARSLGLQLDSNAGLQSMIKGANHEAH